MRRALLAILLAAAVVVAASPRALAAGSCGPRGARTAATSEDARVYSFRGDFYGCAVGSRRSYLLGPAEWECLSSSGCEGVDGLRLAGRFVAYSWYRNSGGADQTLTGSMYVRDLRTGRYRHEHEVGSFGADAGIGGFRVTARGAVGYIVDRTPSQSRNRLLEVWRMDGRGRRRLDRGRQIEGSSLSLAGGRFSWINGKKRRFTALR